MLVLHLIQKTPLPLSFCMSFTARAPILIERGTQDLLIKKAPLSSSLKDAVAFMVYGYTPLVSGCQ